MEAVKYKVLNMDGKEVGSVDLDGAIFGAEEKKNLVHTTVVWQLNKRRAGSHSTQTRGEMKGGGKKPYRQKGTGRARVGTITSPTRVGGGVAHGPHPRSYESRIPKRTRQQAMCSVLTSKVQGNDLVVLDKLEIEGGKTKSMKQVLNNLGVKEFKALILMPQKDDMVWRSSSNLSGVDSIPIAGVNVYDLLNHKFLICTQECVQALEARLTKANAS